MTDTEIIKALECCKKDDCDNCPNDFGNCYANLAGYALDLINRQKAEIKRLEKELETEKNQVIRLENQIGRLLSMNQAKLDTIHDIMAENERLKTEKDNLIRTYAECQAEAVKEFADKVLLYIPNIEGDTTIKCVEEAIKQTLKETVGDADA
jgi:archaellum component FlaC